MNQAELIDAIAADPTNSSVSKSSIKWVLDSTAAIAKSALKSGDEVTLPGIGKLSVKIRAARKGRNPATGADIDIPARNVPHFSAAKYLKDAVAYTFTCSTLNSVLWMMV